MSHPRTVSKLGGARPSQRSSAKRSIWETVNPASFTLREAGPDGVLGTGDDRFITGGAVTYRDEAFEAVMTFSDILAFRSL